MDLSLLQGVGFGAGAGKMPEATKGLGWEGAAEIP